MLTKKHFEQLSKIHGEAYKLKAEGKLDQAFIIFDGGLRNFYTKNNSRFDSITFAKAVAKYSK